MINIKAGSFFRPLVSWAFLFAMMFGQASSAQTLRFEFESEVSFVDDRFSQVFSLGQPVTGFYEYDINEPDSDPDPADGIYNLIDFQFRIGDFSEEGRFSSLLIRTNPTVDDTILNLAMLDENNEFITLAGYKLNTFTLRFIDRSNTQFLNDNLKREAPNLSVLSIAEWALLAEVEPRSVERVASGRLLSVTLVPEPKTLGIFAIGLLAAVVIQNRRR